MAQKKPETQPRRRMRGFEAAAQLVAHRVKAVGEGRGFAATRLLTHWPEVVGPELAAHTRPVRISHGKSMGATLTLPGIAGIILCLGIAVDSNILIFSRIREETAKGAGAIKALTQGYARAWATILDANVTTLLAMVLLFMFGAGAIRGFAVTMSLGIMISMFTAVVLMRWVMEALVRRRKPARLEIAPLIGRVPAPGAFSFMRRSGLALATSAVLSLAAVGALVLPGPNLGIDFTGGVQMVLRSDTPVPLAGLRAAIAAGVPGDASLQAFGDPTEALIRVQGEAGQATVAAVETVAAQAVPGAVFDQIDLVGPTISGELAATGLIALSFAVLAMLVYIWLRFEWHFAAGAIAVLGRHRPGTSRWSRIS